jgi:hypothetical protein
MNADAAAVYVGVGLLTYHGWGLVGAGAALLGGGVAMIVLASLLEPSPHRSPRRPRQ